MKKALKVTLPLPKFKHGEPRDKEAGHSRAKIGPQTANFGVNTEII